MQQLEGVDCAKDTQSQTACRAPKSATRTKRMCSEGLQDSQNSRPSVRSTTRSTPRVNHLQHDTVRPSNHPQQHSDGGTPHTAARPNGRNGACRKRTAVQAPAAAPWRRWGSAGRSRPAGAGLSMALLQPCTRSDGISMPTSDNIAMMRQCEIMIVTSSMDQNSGARSGATTWCVESRRGCFRKLLQVLNSRSGQMQRRRCTQQVECRLIRGFATEAVQERCVARNGAPGRSWT
jgi:hypothetical protein